MKYCTECGTKLITKTDGIDGQIPYCPSCEQFRYLTFNSAISTVMLNPQKDKILLIEQYGRKDNILVAGYVMKGEDDEETLIREIKEEVNLDVTHYLFNDCKYYDRTNTLIHNYITVLNDEQFTLTNEVDFAKWYTIDEALKAIKPGSLAEYFLQNAVKKIPLLKNNEIMKKV